MYSQSEILPVSIPLITRIKAEQFRRYQVQTSKAKQVYLNTLAVSVVNSYLNLIGWSTNLEASDSWNPILQTMMDVADLLIPNYGKLECRVVLDNEETVTIPPEVWSERIGYVVVRFNKFLDQATILGFIGQVRQVKLPLTQLEPLTKFPTYLSQQKCSLPVQPTNLSKWFLGMLDQGWQPQEKLFCQTVALHCRSTHRLAKQTVKQLSPSLTCVKLLELIPTKQITLALILNIQSQNQKEFDILITVCNNQTLDYLPNGLELVVLDEVQHPVMVAQANEVTTIEFYFSGKLGESFSVEMSLEENTKVESFII
ncbi:MAG: DUF1822 family protein [Waterburya sp.]